MAWHGGRLHLLPSGFPRKCRVLVAFTHLFVLPSLGQEPLLLSQERKPIVTLGGLSTLENARLFDSDCILK